MRTAGGLGKSLLAMGVLLLGSLPAWAQISSAPPLTQAGDQLQLSAIGATLDMPLPDWLDAGNAAAVAAVDAHYVSDAGRAVVEIYRKDEIQALWKTLYGASIVETEATAAQYREQVIALFAQSCRPRYTAFAQLGQDQGDALAPLSLVCGAYSDRLANFAGEGEVMVASFKKTGPAIAMVFQRWRGPAFDPRSVANWPVDPRTAQTRAEQLQARAALAAN